MICSCLPILNKWLIPFWSTTVWLSRSMDASWSQHAQNKHTTITFTTNHWLYPRASQLKRNKFIYDPKLEICLQRLFLFGFEAKKLESFFVVQKNLFWNGFLGFFAALHTLFQVIARLIFYATISIPTTTTLAWYRILPKHLFEVVQWNRDANKEGEYHDGKKNAQNGKL